MASGDKSFMMEYFQKRKQQSPTIFTNRVDGEDHHPMFESVITHSSWGSSKLVGRGTTKKLAEFEACAKFGPFMANGSGSGSGNSNNNSGNNNNGNNTPLHPMTTSLPISVPDQDNGEQIVLDTQYIPSTEYQQILDKERITPDIYHLLTVQDLRVVGIPIGIAARILKK